MVQRRFESMRDIKPPRPEIQDDAIAEEIAKHIIEAVNLDEFYWDGDDIQDRIGKVRDEIIANGAPEHVFRRLAKKEPPASCSGEKSAQCRVYEGIADHCEHITKAIVAEVMEAANKRYDERYC